MSHKEERTERIRKSNSKEAAGAKQSGSPVTAKEKPTILETKRKKNQPQLSQDNFEKPQSSLGMHMLESAQGFHTPGKETDRKPEFCSSVDCGNYRSPFPLLCPSTSLHPSLKSNFHPKNSASNHVHGGNAVFLRASNVKAHHSTEEQRPEYEEMERQVQQKQENVAKYNT
ncbi:hypothetical protein MUG91_G222n69 [Manis pentadactyla]|nr:hypothetical protein MUG91_G222n69 [Manis pentadactyla]